MKIKFQSTPWFPELFEHEYEECLQNDKNEKLDLLSRSDNATWMFVDDFLAGEIYGLTPKALNEEIPDLDLSDEKSIYCNSFTILREWQNKGLGKILFAYWIGLLHGKNHHTIILHATSPAMEKLCFRFGFTFFNRHENWFGSGRSSIFAKLNSR